MAMPWKATSAMDQRLSFIAEFLKHQETVTDLCARFGISRKTGHKWINRYTEIGVDEVIRRLPFRIHVIQTDNGPEFQSKFHWHLRRRDRQDLRRRIQACRKNKLGSVDRRDGDRRVVGRSDTG
jgi:Homeodomain-like domain-containing protein